MFWAGQTFGAGQAFRGRVNLAGSTIYLNAAPLANHSRQVSRPEPPHRRVCRDGTVVASRGVTGFSVLPAREDRWLASVSRHWTLDGQGPR